MNKTLRLSLNLLALTAMLAGTAFVPVQQEGDPNIRVTQVDTANFPQVTLYVSVTDDSGEPYLIDPSRLVISENGQQIPLDQISGIGDVGALTTMLVMDISGSMAVEHKLDSAKAAANEFIDRMRENDQAGLISFNTKIETVQPLTSDKQALYDAVDSLVAVDDTAMYDAIDSAIDQLEGQDGRKAIIVLTDGIDNSSSISDQDVIERSSSSGFSISTVGLGVPGTTNKMSGIDEDGLQDLAARAGGVYGYAEDEDALTRLYETYAIAMQSEYAITYTSPATLRDGVNRSLSVSLAPVGGGQPVANQDSRYNPGGLVPEVAQPASWPLFAALVLGLAVLAFVPMLLSGLNLGAMSLGGSKSNGRVKLKPQSKSRIKLK